MKFLNLGCGGCRPPYLNVPRDMKIGNNSPWINVDNLHVALPNEESNERKQLAREKNYVNCDIREGLSFPSDYADGILASHFLEHLDIQESISFLKECYRVLKPEGVLRLSVPCPKKILSLSEQGLENKEAWGEQNPHIEGMYPPLKTYMDWIMFFPEHKQIVSDEAIRCYLWHIGFSEYSVKPFKETWAQGLEDLDNREPFSVFIEGKK